MTRQIALDTETTGISPQGGHRIIEIGAVELINRRLTGQTFHYYLQPDRKIDIGAMKVHGITNEFLNDKPRFNEIADELKVFINDAELIIHNAPFDVGFLNHELNLIEDEWQDINDYCTILDTLMLARKKHPGQKNNLDALCQRYRIDNGSRTLHGALLDAQILSKVYLAMTGGQTHLALQEESLEKVAHTQIEENAHSLLVLKATDEEVKAHEAMLAQMHTQSNELPLWLSISGLSDKE